MPFVSGTANSLSDLLAALVGACVANGWSSSGAVLHKGGCFARLQVVSGSLELLGGTGIDGNNQLTGVGPDPVRLGTSSAGPFFPTWPVRYEIHVHANPDEVYCLINYDIDRWQHLVFGLSDVAGLPGTGMFYGASLPSVKAGWDDNITLYTDYGGYNYSVCPALFFSSHQSPTTNNSFCHHGFIDGWSRRAPGDGSGSSRMVYGEVSASKPLVPRYARQPNAYNAAATLLDYKVWCRREDNKNSLVLDFAHARLIRVDNYSPQDVIELTPDRWRVYPWHRKNSVERDAGREITHTGTLGWAIRYDGP